jgi:hypothetical protein
MRHFATVGAILLLGVAAACAGEDPGDRSPSATPTSSQAPASGRVDVGGYELAYACRGEGSPTILTEAGYDSAGVATWLPLMDDLASISRVCSYDRAGTGESDPRPKATDLTSADQADELHALVQGAGIDAPYVLVAHSYGGFVSRLYAAAHPDETAGLVLIESSHEDEIAAYEDHYGQGDPRADWIDGGDLLDIDATDASLRDARDLGDLPLVVIRAEVYTDVLEEDLWRRTQADLATLSSNSLHIIALGSRHFVMDDNPRSVIEAVEAVIDAARSDGDLPACGDFVDGLAAACP